MTNIHSKFYVRISGQAIRDIYVQDEVKFHAKKNKVETSKLSDDDKLRLEGGIIQDLLASYSPITFDNYKKSDYSIKCKVVENAINKKNDKTIEMIKGNFNPETTKYSNLFLIDMEKFEKFVSFFSDTISIDWTDISKNPYYDWKIDILRSGKYVLDWIELAKNKTVSKLFKMPDYSKELTQLKNDNTFYQNGKLLLFPVYEEVTNGGKSLFIIMEYGVPTISEYFLLEDVIKKSLKNNCPSISKITWLSEYAPYDRTNKERMMFELKEFDYILTVALDTYEKENNVAHEIYNYAVQNGFKIFSSVNELSSASHE